MTRKNKWLMRQYVDVFVYRGWESMRYAATFTFKYILIPNPFAVGVKTDDDGFEVPIYVKNII